MYHKQTKSKRFKNIENVAIRNFLTQQQEVSDFEFAQKLMEEEASAEKKRAENKGRNDAYVGRTRAPVKRIYIGIYRRRASTIYMYKYTSPPQPICTCSARYFLSTATITSATIFFRGEYYHGMCLCLQVA